jgi:hypothetical protein
LHGNDQVAKVIAAAETAIDAVRSHVTPLLDRQQTTAVVTATPVPAAPAKPPAKASAAKATPAKRTTTRRATKA